MMVLMNKALYKIKVICTVKFSLILLQTTIKEIIKIKLSKNDNLNDNLIQLQHQKKKKNT